MSKPRKSFMDLSRKGKYNRLKRMRFEETRYSESETVEEIQTYYCGVDGSNGDSSGTRVSDDVIFEHYEKGISDNSSKNSDTDDEPEKFKADDLRHWAVNYQITHVALTALLCVMKKHPCFEELPSTARTLLDTPVSLPISNVNPGQYCHMGLSAGIKNLWKHLVEKVSQIDLAIGIDGLPLFKSGPGEVWPIMASIVNVPSLINKVFPIGIYYGKKKPADCRQFLKMFVEEAATLCTDGILINGQNISVSIKAFLCDAPAKSYILGVKGHTGYSSCTKCKQTGVWENNKVIFTEFNSLPRTHEEFLIQADEDFHVGTTNLHLLPNIDFIKSFPLDYMHLICLGVTRTLMYTWKFAPPPLKLPSNILNSISSALISFQNSIPSEFCRKPRGLDEVKRWKATEFRQFLLYTGPVILKKELQYNYRGYYENFLSLHIATRILLSPKYFKHLEYAKDLMKFFVETAIQHYGPQLITHNFHNLLHIPDDVSNLGNINIYSAFKFENYLGKIKRLVKSGNKPLQQICRRLTEIEKNSDNTSKGESEPDQPIFLKQRTNGPRQQYFEFEEEFCELKFNKFKIKASFPDSCCTLKDGRVVIVYSMGKLKHSSEMSVLFKAYSRKENFFSHPFCESSALNIYSVKKLLQEFEICSISHISEKMVLLNYSNEVIVMPFLQIEDGTREHR